METPKRTVRPAKVEIISRERTYDGFFKIDKYRVKHEQFDGSISDDQTIEVFERGDAVAALLLDVDEDEIFLVEQFRLPTLTSGSGWIVELPAGMIREGEAPEACLRREVIEETGYQVTEMTEIVRFYCSPGGSSERILYYAEVRATDKKSAGGGVVRDGEDILVKRIKVEDFFQKLARHEFADAKLIIAGQWLEAQRAKLPAEKSVTSSRTVEFRLAGSDKIIGYKTGSIIAVKDVDVWVNPTDTDMVMDPFNGRSVSATIRLHGAEKYEDSERIKEDTVANALRQELGIRNFVLPTTVVNTTAGTLERTHSVKRIFHVAVVPGAIGEGLAATPETLEACVEKVLVSIESKNGGFLRGTPAYKSVLIPILGTGQGGFFTRDAVPRLVRPAIQYFRERPKAGLSKIYFCGYSSRDREILEDVLSAAVRAGELEPVAGNAEARLGSAAAVVGSHVQ